MDENTAWSLLRGTPLEQERGLNLVQMAYSQRASPSHAMELGVAYLWLGKFQPAWAHFRHALEILPTKNEIFYGMAGVAKWCLGNPNEAVSEWQTGLEAKYARAGGLNIRIPLLLYFASVIRPDVFERTVAKELMQRKIEDRRASNWPGPIASWLLGQMAEEELGNRYKVKDPTIVKAVREAAGQQWLAEFYGAVSRYEPSKRSDFRASMLRLTDLSQPEWMDQNYFLSRLWCEEFFLARGEQVNDTRQPKHPWCQ